MIFFPIYLLKVFFFHEHMEKKKNIFHSPFAPTIYYTKHTRSRILIYNQSHLNNYLV